MSDYNYTQFYSFCVNEAVNTGKRVYDSYITSSRIVNIDFLQYNRHNS
jgi:hypothetical protein